MSKAYKVLVEFEPTEGRLAAGDHSMPGLAEFTPPGTVQLTQRLGEHKRELLAENEIKTSAKEKP